METIGSLSDQFMDPFQSKRVGLSVAPDEQSKRYRTKGIQSMTNFSKMTLIMGISTLGLAACTSTDMAEKDMSDKVEMASASGDLCTTMGPQTPRDITSKVGLNTTMFAMAPPSTEMNLCNIHTHTNAEHKGPGFSIFAGATDDGGYQCNETPNLSTAELAPYTGPRSYEGAEPGDTIEVHWVHTTCDTLPGEGLGNCVAQVTWSVRPQCAKVDVRSVHNWAKSDTTFNETKSHGVRQLVTAPELLSEIQ